MNQQGHACLMRRRWGQYLWQLAQAIQWVDVRGCRALKACQGVVVQLDFQDCVHGRL